MMPSYLHKGIPKLGFLSQNCLNKKIAHMETVELMTTIVR